MGSLLRGHMVYRMALVEKNLGIQPDLSELPTQKLVHCTHEILINTVQVYDRFQFERNGFFTVDRDNTAQNLVFNLTVGLKEDSGK